MNLGLSALFVMLAYFAWCPPSPKDDAVRQDQEKSSPPEAHRDAAYAAAVAETARLERLIKQQPSNRSALRQLAKNVQALVRETTSTDKTIEGQKVGESSKQPRGATAVAPSGPVKPSAEPTPEELIERQRKYLERTHRPVPLGGQTAPPEKVRTLAHVSKDVLSKRAANAIEAAKNLEAAAADPRSSTETIRALAAKLRQRIDGMSAHRDEAP